MLFIFFKKKQKTLPHHCTKKLQRKLYRGIRFKAKGIKDQIKLFPFSGNVGNMAKAKLSHDEIKFREESFI